MYDDLWNQKTEKDFFKKAQLNKNHKLCFIL